VREGLTMKHTFFTVRKTERICVRELTVKVTAKRTWATDDNGNRFLIGSTAFYTRAGAERAKLGRLQRIIDTPALQRMYGGAVWDRAHAMLQRYKANGYLH
jgi:hypothetical protein